MSFLNSAWKFNSCILTSSVSFYTFSYALRTNTMILLTFCLVISLARSKSLLVTFPVFQVIIQNTFANYYATTQCNSQFTQILGGVSSLLFQSPLTIDLTLIQPLLKVFSSLSALFFWGNIVYSADNLRWGNISQRKRSRLAYCLL